MLVVQAIHTFIAEHGDELEFQAGEDIEVLEKDDAFGDGWWRGRNTKGEEGLFPATYISESQDETARPESPTAHPVSPPPAPEPLPPSPKAVPVSDGAPKGVLDSATEVLGQAATSASNVMGRTLGEIQDAIESIAKPESEDDGELGIGHDARARLAAQAKIANDQRDKQRESGAVAGLVYSDESEDDEDEPRRNLGAFANGASPKIGTDPTSKSPHIVQSAEMNNVHAPPPTSNHSSLRAARETNLPPSASSSLRSPREAQDSLQPALPLPATPPLHKLLVSMKEPALWSVDEVVAWAESKGFEEGLSEKFREHEISGDLLLELDANLLKELDIPQFGKRLRIAQAIAELRRPVPVSAQEMSQRGMSAPPSAVASITPPLVTPPASASTESATHAAWIPSRRTSSNTAPLAPPVMEAIKENQAQSPASVPASPVTPNSSITKRESTGSMGHKRGKASVDNKDRLSFFGRARKPAPSALSPGDQRTPRVPSSNRVHQMQPATPEQNRKTSGPLGTAMALRQIGTPDHSGYMKKKGDRYGNWKARFFVLKGSHLYYMKSEQEDKVKGHIDVRGYRVIVDENTNPGAYGFRLVGNDKPHSFSSTEQSAVREWMKALMKATIARDYTVPVTSSCNIPTIPLAEAQALNPRPPSPATREATQRATRRENTNQLTAHDASVLMSLDTSRRASQNLAPSRPSRDNRRPSSTLPRPTSFAPAQEHRPDLVNWVNELLPPPYPKAALIPDSFVSGEVIFLLVRSLSGIEPSPPVPPTAFAPEGGLPGLSGLFAMMDILIDAGIDTAGVSINEIRQGDVDGVSRLLESVQAWATQRGVTN